MLSGGEIAALAVLDACVRLIPGVMGKEASGEEESFEKGLLEYPHYTRPRTWEGRAIPDVLLSGDHAKIAEWRRAEAERITRERRPDSGRLFSRQGRRLTHVSRRATRERGLPRRHRVFAAVVVEAALGLAAEPAGLDVFHQERAGAVFRIRQALVQHLHHGETGVEADEVGEL